MLISKVYIIVLVLFLGSCGSEENAPKSKNDSIIIQPQADSVNSELVKAKKLYDRFYIENIKSFEESNPDSLIYRYDSLQIRFWRIGGFYTYRMLYVIKTTNSVWAGHYYFMEPDSLYSNGIGSKEFLNGPEPLHITKRKEVRPKSGWKNFIDSLTAFNLMTLPDMDKVPDLKTTWLHSTSHIIEIAGKNFYRIYKYEDPQEFEDKFWQAEKMARISGLFLTELGH
jgi:hypothetical protein